MNPKPHFQYTHSMHFIDHYTLFLFDFDGVLVDSEKFHYQAYQNVCQKRGFTLPLSWEEYQKAALYTHGGLQAALYQTLPELKKQEPRWSVLYQEKKAAYLECVRVQKMELMPGAEAFLSKIASKGLPYCVVTNSNRQEVEAIARHHPVLQAIPKWFTREDYQEPKPHPECYLKALQFFNPKGRVVGFEDSPKGLTALIKAQVEAHLVGAAVSSDEKERLSHEVGSFCSLSSFLEL